MYNIRTIYGILYVASSPGAGLRVGTAVKPSLGVDIRDMAGGNWQNCCKTGGVTGVEKVKFTVPLDASESECGVSDDVTVLTVGKV